MQSALIITALTVEYKAVCEHLTALKEEVHLEGNVYERGVFSSNGCSFDVGIVQIGKGNIKAVI